MTAISPETSPDDAIATAWAVVQRSAERLSETSLRDLFATNPGRVETMTVEAAGIRADLSKQRVDDEALTALLGLVTAADVTGRRDAMFAGEHINTTENRAVLHTALRLPREAVLNVDGQDVVADVHDVLNRMANFCDRVRSGAWTGTTGQRIKAVVNIGIGGSDLGPVMAYQALRHYSDRDITFRFVSNVDGSDFAEATHDLDPASTLFIVASKTFTTQETMSNATTARAWLLAAHPGANVAKHFVALSTNHERVVAFGIGADNMFGFWDWVGGRYSMESAIGLSTMLAIGPESYRELLAGFHAMDEHFRTAEPSANLPMLMGALGVWNRNFLGASTVAVLPYEQYLVRFPAYLQQLTMESNGKHVRHDGSRVQVETGPIYWGEPGTNGQHSFYQLIHQGTSVIPCDLIAFRRSLNPTPAEVGTQHDLLVANAIAQAAVLAFGRSADEVRADGTAEELVPHKEMEGNRPSTFLMLEEMTPFALGTLVSLYEHIVFTQSVIWGINAFDQWGVELGKVLAVRIAPLLTSDAVDAALDASTLALVKAYKG